jgi:hypothetical protein
MQDSIIESAKKGGSVDLGNASSNQMAKKSTMKESQLFALSIPKVSTG